MTNFNQRTITGAGLVIIILTAVRLGPYTLVLLLLLINLLSLQEFYRLLKTNEVKPFKMGGYTLSTSLILSCLIVLTGIGHWHWLLINIPVAFGSFVNALYRPVKKPFLSLAVTFFGITCTTLPLCLFLAGCFFTPPGNYQFEIPAGIFLLLWTNDTGAYLFGRKLGKRQLFARLSPKKTWEGSFGGAVAALTTGYILSCYFILFNVIEWELLALLIIVGGTYGDFIKSMLKRSVGVKDSGTILPGHGGVLDRFDSLLGSAPFIFIYLLLLKR